MCGSFKGVGVCILVIVNFVFAAAGLLMLAFGIAAAVQPDSIIKALSYVGDISQKSSSAGFDLAGIIQSSSVFLIVMGAIVGLVGLFGCIGACCNVKWMLSVYLVVLILILLAEIALIIFASLYPKKFQDETQILMKQALNQHFHTDVTISSNGTLLLPLEEVNLAWTSMQFELGCCGAYGYSDYASINFTSAIPRPAVPVSCCQLKGGPGKLPSSQADFVDLKGCQSPNPSNSTINTGSCYTAVESLINGFGKIAIGIAAAIIGVEVILILLTVWVCRSIGTDRSKGV